MKTRVVTIDVESAIIRFYTNQDHFDVSLTDIYQRRSLGMHRYGYGLINDWKSQLETILEKDFIQIGESYYPKTMFIEVKIQKKFTCQAEYTVTERFWSGTEYSELKYLT